MIEAVISSRTKINILIKLFLNPGTRAYLRELAKEFKVSTNAVRTELNILTKHRILVCERDGRQVHYAANQSHPLFPELSSMVRKITGIDVLINSVVERLGKIECVYLIGDYARGKDTGIIDIVLVGEIDRQQLEDVVFKTEKYINRKIRPLILLQEEFEQLIARGSMSPASILWRMEKEDRHQPNDGQ